MAPRGRPRCSISARCAPPLPDPDPIANHRVEQAILGRLSWRLRDLPPSRSMGLADADIPTEDRSTSIFSRRHRNRKQVVHQTFCGTLVSWNSPRTPSSMWSAQGAGAPARA